jgi:GNAT superfamily N-acetyltransferase
MFIRPPNHGGDLNFCCGLVAKNWGAEAADRCTAQFVESFNDGPYAPVFCILDIEVAGAGPIGFAAYQPSMKMKGSFDLIWIAVHDQYKGGGAGKALTEWRIDDIKKRGGQMIELVTQKPDYFAKFGFISVYHLGNQWYLMLKLLKPVEI